MKPVSDSVTKKEVIKMIRESVNNIQWNIKHKKDKPKIKDIDGILKAMHAVAAAFSKEIIKKVKVM